MFMTASKTTIALQDGTAELMGEGVAVLLQKDERGHCHSVVVTAEDLRGLLANLEA